MRILLIEDDDAVASLVQSGLTQSGFCVDCAADGETGLSMALSQSYDAAVVDIMLPKLDGLALIREARSRNVRTPMIILSARGAVEDRVTGLHDGGDDYLTKPFAMSELTARIEALLRRTHIDANPVSLTVGDLSMDLLKHEVKRAGKVLDIQPREYTLLEYLMRNVGIVISKNMIMQQVWHYNFDPQTNIVDVLVCRLRTKIDKDFEFKMLHTVRGAGYILKKPV